MLHAAERRVRSVFATSLAERILGVERDALRVLTHDVGGSFGMKSSPYPEYVALLLAARRLGRAGEVVRRAQRQLSLRPARP